MDSAAQNRATTASNPAAPSATPAAVPATATAPAPTTPTPALDAVARADIAARPCILFDFDGTLANTTGTIVRNSRIALREYGMSEAQMGNLKRLIGPPFPRAFSSIYGLSTQDAQRITERYRQLDAQAGLAGHPLFPGIKEMLEALHAAGRRLAIASSKREAMLTPMLDELGIFHLFEAISAQTDPDHADKPYLVRHALELLHADPAHAVMVGDRFYDIQGAHATGIPVVATLFNTAERPELEEAGATVIVESVEELRCVLLGL